MALTVSFDGVNVTKAEDTTNWSSSNISGPNLWTEEINLQGNSCVGFLAANKSGYGVYTSPTSFNFQTTYSGSHIFIWLNITMPGTLKALSEGGLYLMVGSDTDNYNKYLIASEEYSGVLENGFRRFVLDPTVTPTESVGSVNLAAVKVFGVWIDAGKTARVEQVFIDRIDIGTGLTVYGTSTDFWNDLLNADVGEVSGVRENMYGVIQEVDGTFFLYGRLRIGDSLGFNSTNVSDFGKAVKFVSQRYYTGSAWSSMVSEDLLKIELVDNIMNPTKFRDGILDGEDAGRLGSSFIGAAHHATGFDASAMFNPNSYVKLYSTRVYNYQGDVKLSNAPNSAFLSGAVHNCGTVYPMETKVKKCHISDTASEDAAVCWCEGADISDVTFSSHSNGAALKMPDNSQSTYNFNNLIFVDNSIDVDNQSGGHVNINKKQGANPETYTNDTTFMSTVTITITGSVNLTGAEIRVYDLDSPESRNLGTELSGVESNPYPFYSYTGELGNAVWLQIMLPGYKEYGQEVVIPNNDTLFTAYLEKDTNT
jgi:hypothetical protein